MKGRDSFIYIFGTDDPSDPAANATGIVPLIANPDGALWAQLTGGGPTPTPIGSGPWVDDAADPDAEALNVRAVLYAQGTLGGFETVLTMAMGTANLDVTPQQNGLLVNAGLYLRDGDLSTGEIVALPAFAQGERLAAGSKSPPVLAQLYGWDGTQQVVVATVSAAQAATTECTEAAMVQSPGEWIITHSPAAATQATATKAAGGAGVRHICRSISIGINAVAAIVAPVVVNLRDGATGAGTILRTWRLTCPAGDCRQVDIAGLNIVGSENTAMTIETTASPGATNFATVNASGVSAGTSAPNENLLTMLAGDADPPDGSEGFYRLDGATQGSITAGDEDDVANGLHLEGVYSVVATDDGFNVFLSFGTGSGMGPDQDAFTSITIETDDGLRTFVTAAADDFGQDFGQGYSFWTWVEPELLFTEGNSYDMTIEF